MKANLSLVLLLALFQITAAEPVKMTSRTLLRKRLDKYFYFSTVGIETKLDAIDKMD